MKATWVEPIRTAIQCLIALIPVVPALVPAVGLNATAGIGATAIALSAVATRIMMVPGVERLLEKLGIHTR